MKQVLVVLCLLLSGCITVSEFNGEINALNGRISALESNRLRDRDTILSFQKKLDNMKYDSLILDDMRSKIYMIQRYQDNNEKRFKFLEKFKQSHDLRWPNLIDK